MKPDCVRPSAPVERVRYVTPSASELERAEEDEDPNSPAPLLSPPWW